MPTEGYYAYRLLLRALRGGKDRLNFASTGLAPGQALVLRDPSGLYVLVRNAIDPVTVKIGAVPGYGGTATLDEYSAFKKDEVVGTVPVVSNQFTITAGDSSLTLATIPPVLACGGKTTTLVGTDDVDFLTGTPDVDVIAGLGGNDVIEGLAGNDTLGGGPDTDTCNGGKGTGDTADTSCETVTGVP